MYLGIRVVWINIELTRVSVSALQDLRVHIILINSTFCSWTSTLRVIFNPFEFGTGFRYTTSKSPAAAQKPSLTGAKCRSVLGVSLLVDVEACALPEA